MQPAKLATKVLDKVWGSPLTEPWYQNPEGRNIGEIWFSASDATPILVKFLFTSDNLSVQVHPADGYAAEHENGSPGKTEMWHILRAEPGAKIAAGLRDHATRAEIHDAAVNGQIVGMLNWIEVHPGDTFFIPAGTIHAIGGGLALCEVQQVSDVTYRIYDWDRPRPLQLERSLDVAELKPRDARVQPADLGPGRELLAECDYFKTERLSVDGSVTLGPRETSYLCVALAGEGTLAGQSFHAGEAWEVGRDCGPVSIESRAAAFLITGRPYRMP